MPKPEMLEIKKHKDDLYIGIPKETHFDEKRICLTPNAVAALTSNGHRIVVESGAGDGTNYIYYQHIIIIPCGVLTSILYIEIYI